MNRKATGARADFCVLCIWCGTKIRDDNREDASGMCLKCFYRILRERLQAQRRSVGGESVSER